MKNIKVISIVLIILASIFAISFFRNRASTTQPITQTQNSVVKNIVTQKINFGSDKPVETIEVEFDADESVLSILRRTNDIKVKEYSFGTIVESIDELVNGTDNKNWMYFVNEKEATVGAGDYKVNAGDVIEWRFKAYEE